ncbi:peptide chain release factor N(5)-glutamine methyltransferase [Cognatishimia activa]|uniref:Release factor glutamine methyltransferase n=1 Tax=Cognatishimia activa TaxID=1715691 RepID=A0A0P1IZR5_9RHOB|nr:peptide chain release factor N(5)-glutamine methyltransferase [Cognatishimia activa]CUJ32069.1 Release factor glutamine methyltransferase [Cognatishimia activa]CUK27157.1 Release factor glutamine methyltransferase [Cognatishimia activa]
MILRVALMEGTRALRDAGIAGPERDARLLLAEVLGMSVGRLTLEPDWDVTEEQIKRFHGYLARRSANEPVSRILGRRNFWGRDFEVTPDVLDPRPETECLIEAALKGPSPKRLIDLGCGSGIIGVTLLAEWPQAKGVCSDVSQPCLAVTTRNATTHGVRDRLEVQTSSWFEGIAGTFDLIVSNPPYITEEEMAHLSPDVALHDPHLALTPGGDGLSPYRILATGTAMHLAPGGRILVEIGWKQGADVAEIFSQSGLIDVEILPDLDGRDRIVLGRKPH